MNQFIKNQFLILLLAVFTVFALPGIANSADIPLRKKIDNNFDGIQLRGGVKLDQEKQVVTLNLRDSDMRQVLRMLADKANLNIILHDSVKGNITIDLVDVDLNKAFEYIMTMNNLTYWKDDNTLIVAENDEAEDLGINISKIKSIKVKYTDAAKIATFLNQNIFSVNRPNTSTSSIITTNPSTNEILVFGSDDDIKLAEEVIQYLDIKPQVRNYEVNFVDPVSIATKICWTVFRSDEGEDSVSKDAELEEGSEAQLVCGNTSEPPNESDSDVLEDFGTPSYWVLADSGLNQITIYGGTSEQLNMADEIIRNFDKREPQVYLEVSILEINHTDKQGVELNYVLNKGTNKLTFAEGSVGINDIGKILHNGRAWVTPGEDSDGNIVNMLETIMTTTKARLLSNPRIISANNTESTIKISEEIIESVDITRDAVTDEVETTVNIGDGDSIEFSILPKISPNGYVTISLPDFKLDSLAGQAKLGEASANLKNSREVGVKSVRVKDGDTFIIGGLMQEREQISHGKVPVLSSIPVLGVLFQQQSTTKIRTELIIMITPRILKDADEVAESV